MWCVLFEGIILPQKLLLLLVVFQCMTRVITNTRVLTACVFFLAGWRCGPVDFDLLQRATQRERARWDMNTSFTSTAGRVRTIIKADLG